MADFDGAVYSQLAATSAVTDLVSTRIYRAQLPQAPTYPAISYFLVSADRIYEHDGAAGMNESRVQIDCWAETAEGARALGEAVRAALEAVTGTWGSDTIQHSFLDNEQHVYDDEIGLHHRSLDFLVGFLE